MPTNSFRAALTCLVLVTIVGVTGALAANPNLDSTDVMIPTGDVGIELFIRNKHPAGVENFSSDRILLYVHGATYPSETAFDLPIEGVSMIDMIATRVLALIPSDRCPPV